MTLINRSLLSRGGAPCNGLNVQFVPRPFEYSTFSSLLHVDMGICIYNLYSINFKEVDGERLISLPDLLNYEKLAHCIFYTP